MAGTLTTSLPAPRTDPLPPGRHRFDGPRARRTREALLTSLLVAIEHTAFRDVSITDVSRAAGKSPPTFYQYFDGMTDAIAALAEQLEPDFTELARQHLAGPWTDDEETSCRFVTAFVDRWGRYRPLLRVVDMLADEGHAAILAARVRVLGGLNDVLVDTITSVRASRLLPAVDAQARSAIIAAMLVRVATMLPILEEHDLSRRRLIDEVARVVRWTITDTG